MVKIIDKLNEYLQTFKPFNDFYKVLIGDDTKTPLDPIENINDENTGAIANPLMWLSEIQDFLFSQIDIVTATDKWLTGLKKYYGVKRNVGETDSDFRKRLQKILFYMKETPVNLAEILKDLADYVEIVDGIEDGMFDDISFDGFYFQDKFAFINSDFDLIINQDFGVFEVSGNDLILSDAEPTEDDYFEVIGNDIIPKAPLNPSHYVREAIDSGGIHGQPYYFRVLLTNPNPNKLNTIAYIVYMSHVVGTYYDIIIVS